MMTTIRDMYISGRDILRSNSIEEADIDARYLLLHCLKLSNSQYYMKQNEEVNDNCQKEYIEKIKLRATRYPLQYITHEASFMGMDFIVNENVLIPRQDTETLVEGVIKSISKNRNDKIKVLDMCTGSGCIGISIAKLVENTSVTGADISKEALEVALKNAEYNSAEVRLVESDLFCNVSERFDYIVSNPPYIRTDVIRGLMPEVRDYEPVIALDGSEDGLLYYRRIISEAISHLNKDGELWFEIGYDQAQAVSKLFEESGYQDIRVIKDMPGLDRVVCARI